MTINKTTTDLSTLKINYLTQEMYEDALENEEINENELYITPGSGTIDSTSAPTANKIAEFDSTAHMNSEDMTSQEVDDFVDSLNITTIRAVDYVVEQGTNGSWTYRKWDSGIAECWGTAESGTYTNTNAWGSGKYMNIGAISFPSGLFVAKPNLIASIEKPSGAGMPFLSILNVSASGFSGYIYDNNTDSTGYAYNIYAHAIGRWK